jgi:hypothetical protein
MSLFQIYYNLIAKTFLLHAALKKKKTTFLLYFTFVYFSIMFL